MGCAPDLTPGPLTQRLRPQRRGEHRACGDPITPLAEQRLLGAAGLVQGARDTANPPSH